MRSPTVFLKCLAALCQLLKRHQFRRSETIAQPTFERMNALHEHNLNESIHCYILFVIIVATKSLASIHLCLNFFPITNRLPPYSDLDMAPRNEKSVYDQLGLGEKRRTIRLLRIEHRNDDTSPIICGLEVAQLEDSPKFSALSYTWGPSLSQEPSYAPKRPCVIQCNGANFPVTENLSDFLRQWSQDPLHQKRLWIDAICIDQQNEDERSRQVHFMAEIYRSAENVLVWLGNEDDSTPLAFALLKDLPDLSDDEQISMDPSIIHASPPGSEIPLRNLTHWQSLSRLFRRAWFNRAWVIQEVVFSNEVIVICGSHTLEWKRMAAASHILTKSNWNSFLHSSELHDRSLEMFPWYDSPTRIAASQRAIAAGSRNGLLHALIRSRKARCSDPRDKVYSQLQLGNAKLYPLYNIGTKEVYINAAKYILKTSEDLLLLAYSEGEDFQSILGLPSWVPDWSVPNILGLGITGYLHFFAAGDMPRTISFSTQGDREILQVEAGQIDVVSDAWGTKSEIRRDARTLIRVLLAMKGRYFTGECREEVLWRTLITDRAGFKIEHPAPSEFGSSFHDTVLWLLTELYTSAEPRNDMSHSGETSQEIMDWEKISRAGIFPSIAEVRDCLHDKTTLDLVKQRASTYSVTYSHAMLLRPFQTRKGYFGLGTQSLKAGDSVWIVPGSRIPLLFRGTMKNIGLVGGAYVHGLMHGEAITRESLKFEVISIE